MKYERFEDLPVWKAAIDLAVRVFDLTARENFKGHGGLRDQIERASVSVSNNIAEGFERGTTQELLTFLYIARGSAAETRSMLRLFDRLPAFGILKNEIASLIPLTESISKQLRSWAGSLQNSEIKGQRYLTDKTRQSDKTAREREEFIEELRRAQEENLARLQRRGAQTRDVQSRDAQSRDAQSRDAQSRDAQSRDAQSRDGQSRDVQSRDGQSRHGQSNDGMRESGTDPEG